MSRTVVIITGASSGMGREFALQLDARLRKTDEIWLITVSFCISVSRITSAPNSKNSQNTPTVIEKQKATMATKTGDKVNLIFAFWFNISTNEKPIAAHKNPQTVCKIVSQWGY